MGHFVYVFGGTHCFVEAENDEDVLRMVENCVWRLDLTTCRWQKMEISHPKPTFFHATCVDDAGNIYFHGGNSQIRNFGGRINHLYRLRVKIPSLSELCWVECLKNAKDLKGLRHASMDMQRQLIKLGYPANFLRRICV